MSYIGVELLLVLLHRLRLIESIHISSLNDTSNDDKMKYWVALFYSLDVVLSNLASRSGTLIAFANEKNAAKAILFRLAKEPEVLERAVLSNLQKLLDGDISGFLLELETVLTQEREI